MRMLLFFLQDQPLSSISSSVHVVVITQVCDAAAALAGPSTCPGLERAQSCLKYLQSDFGTPCHQGETKLYCSCASMLCPCLLDRAETMSIASERPRLPRFQQSTSRSI